MEKLNISTKLEQLKEKKPTTDAHTRTAEVLTEYEKYFNWDNKKYFQDKMRLYMTAHQFVKARVTGVEDMTKLLEWAKSKDAQEKPLHVLQFVELLRQRIPKAPATPSVSPQKPPESKIEGICTKCIEERCVCVKE